MSFLAPAAFALLALLPVIIAMYLLKLRRTEQVVSSVYLWRRMVRDVEANAPWQRLRRNLLLVLQLLFLAALILALARPFTRIQGLSGQAVILILDTSASMAATDVAPSRLAVAQAQARQLIESLPADTRVTVIAAGDVARVLVASSQDRRQARLALDGLEPGSGGSEMASALELASAVAARQPETEIVVLTDGRVTLPERLAVQGRIRYLPIGLSANNQAISTLSLQAAPGGESLTAFAQIANYGNSLAQRRLTFYADGQLVNAYDLDIPAGGQRAVVAEGLAMTTRVLQAQLTGQRTPSDAAHDVLSLDDQAWAVYGRSKPIAVTLVTQGNLFLENALSLLPGLELTVVKPQDWEDASQSSSLTVFDAYVPVTATLPAGNLFFVAPPRSTAYFSVTGTVEQPAPRLAPEVSGSQVDPNHPLLGGADLADGLSGLAEVSVLDAIRMPLPAWARALIVGDSSSVSGQVVDGTVPLLFAGEPDGRRVAVLAFDLHRSDLPLQVAFPLLMANLLGWLAPEGGNLPTQVSPGAALTLSLPPDVESVTVTRPDGSAAQLFLEGGQALFADTDQPGVYRVAWGEGGEAAFAVNLFAPQESDVRPAETLPVAGLAGAESGANSQQARREWWQPLAWLALIVLIVEWLVYYRGTIAQIRGRLERWSAGRSKGSMGQPSSLPILLPFAFVNPDVLCLLLLVPLLIALALVGRRGPTRLRFWSGLALRALLLSLLILALAGAQVQNRADVLTTVFVLDASDSVQPEEQAQGETFIRQAVEVMPHGDQAAIVVFGQDALVERLASQERNLPELTSVPITTRTDIGSALQLALALLPDEGAKRLVLLSDGRENLGHALSQAELAAARGVELSFLSLGGPGGEVEVRVEALDAPTNVRQGQGFDLTVVVQSTAQEGATLRVWGDGQLIHSQSVELQPGTSRYLVPVEAGETGFRRFRAQVVPDADTRLQNNEASAFTVVYGPPRILLVEGQPGEGDSLVRALRAAEMEVVPLPPDELPTTLPELAAYDAIILANAPAAALPAGAMEALPAYVRDLGRGLLMTGGQNAFGAGGYLRTPLEAALPVDMDVRSREQSPNLALVLAVDKSGSMGRCHCDNPDLNQTYVRQEVGQPKVDIAKEAIMRAANAIGPLDYLGVVAFDDAARWAVPLEQQTDLANLEQRVGGIQASGQTNVAAGVQAAYETLLSTQTRIKHIILLTDGWTRSGDISGLARDMRDQGITLSVVAAGDGSAEYLADLAANGGGRYYPARDILSVPDFFLKETVKAVGRYIVEEPFYPLPGVPSPVLRGLDATALPVLLGYNGTTAKGTAHVALTTPQGDPLLATWQYGLGRAAVWTSDAKGQWAGDWVAWNGFARFAAQLAGWTLPAPRVEGLAAQATLEDNGAAITAQATDQDGRPRNFLVISATVLGPDLQRAEAPLAQVGAGRYETLAEVSQPGVYLVELAVREGDAMLGQQTLGLVVPYSPEYKASGTDRALLGELARVTGGGALEQPAAAFVHNLQPAARTHEIWGALLLVTALLFPLDVALRRVMLGPQDARKALAWLRARLPAARHQAVPQERALGRLFRARDRVRERRTRREAPAASPQPTTQSKLPDQPSTSTLSPLSDDVRPGSPGVDLARLRAAKERARRQH
jgi:Mg-chelatase subunit ChlD